MHTELFSLFCTIALTAPLPGDRVHPQSLGAKHDVQEVEKILLRGSKTVPLPYILEHGPKKVATWRKAAEMGVPEGQYLYGRCFLEGAGETKNEKEALKWIEKAANQKLPLAQFTLAILWDIGIDGKKDEVTAVIWYRKAADASFPRAQNAMGNLYETGDLGFKKDPGAAVNWYRKAAEQGCARGQANMGRMYGLGLGGLKKDAREALKWYEKSAASGHAGAMNNIGGMYLNGELGAPDEERAVQWFRGGAEKGSPDAQVNLGWMYDRGLGGLKKDAKQAFSWYEKAAASGQTDAMNNIGVMHRDGEIGFSDQARAVEWFRKAAEKGHPQAQNNLGVMYEFGRGTPRDLTAAILLYRKAAKAGDIFAMRNLGRLAEKTLVAEEPQKWFRMASDAGDGDSSNKLAVMYHLGAVVPKDLAAAKELREKARLALGEREEQRLWNLRLFVAQPVGAKAPDAEVTINGTKAKLSDRKGKTVMLVFGASWCWPCREMKPSLERIEKRYKGEKFELIQLDIDVDKIIAGEWQVDQVPITCILDSSGVVRNRLIGLQSEKELEKALKSVIEQAK